VDGYTTYDAVGLAELVRSRDVKPTEFAGGGADARAGEVNARITQSW
jgi:hypothetical protein